MTLQDLSEYFSSRRREEDDHITDMLMTSYHDKEALEKLKQPSENSRPGKYPHWKGRKGRQGKYVFGY